MSFIDKLAGGMGRSRDFVVSRSLYERQKGRNEIYKMKQELAPHADLKIYSAFKNPESFITDITLDRKDKEEAEKLRERFTLADEEAMDLRLAKKMGCTLAISSKQIWLQKAANKIGVKTKLFS